MFQQRKHPFDGALSQQKTWRVRHYAGKNWGYEADPETQTGPLDPARPLVSQRRFLLFFLTAFVLVLLLCGRLAVLQVARGEELRAAAEENRIRIEQIPAARGVVYDRHGSLLVRNIPNETLQIIPADLPQGETLRASVEKIASILGEPTELVLRDVEEKRSSAYQSSILREHLAYETALKIRLIESSLQGFRIAETATRQYLGGDAFSHVLGYTGKIGAEERKQRLSEGYNLTDQIGKTGLEQFYETTLRGKDGRKQIEVDSLGKEKRVVASETPDLGKNLYISINAEMQKRAGEKLQEVMERTHSTGGAVVALDPRNGEILALVSAPGFNNNLFTSIIDPHAFERLLTDERNPLFFRPISGQYPSGSTIKPLVASAALAEHVIDARTTVNSTGGIRIGQWFFPDWQAGGHGITDVRKAIAQSVNSFFYTIGGGTDTFTGLGVERMVNILKQFGLGRTTGIDLKAEATGLLPTPEWKEKTKKERWYIGDTYHLAIGQGDVLVTPLQMAVSTAAIANGGSVFQPRLVTTIAYPDGHREPVPPSITATLPAETGDLALVREGMRDAVLSGSARSMQSLPVSSAAKTGTAQFGSGSETHAWFTTFAPYENPEIVIAVVVERGGEGHDAALPVARDILQWYFSKDHPGQSAP